MAYSDQGIRGFEDDYYNGRSFEVLGAIRLRDDGWNMVRSGEDASVEKGRSLIKASVDRLEDLDLGILGGREIGASQAAFARANLYQGYYTAAGEAAARAWTSFQASSTEIPEGFLGDQYMAIFGGWMSLALSTSASEDHRSMARFMAHRARLLSKHSENSEYLAFTTSEMSDYTRRVSRKNHMAAATVATLGLALPLSIRRDWVTKFCKLAT
jgi:hypothetical protein